MVDIPLKTQAEFVQAYLRYLYRTNNEADSLRKVVQKEGALLMANKHPLFHVQGPQVVAGVSLGSPKLRKG